MGQILDLILVEDNPAYRTWLQDTLNDSGYSCRPCGSIGQARQEMARRVPDAVIVDEFLPDGRGTAWVSELRSAVELPGPLAILLTGFRSVANSELWFKAGADSCLLKTDRPVRLMATLGALLRRRRWDTERTRVELPGLKLDPVSRMVRMGDVTSSALSAREFAFLQGLVDASPDVLSREDIRRYIFASSRAEQMDLAINEFVRRFRQKIPRELGDAVETVHSRGYRLNLHG